MTFRYVVLTSKHHDGYTLFPSNYSSDWNSRDLEPHRDLVKELGIAVRTKGLMFGVSYSMMEWYNQLFLDDLDAKLQLTAYVDAKMTPELTQIVYDYKPSIIWGNGVSVARSTYFKSKSFLTWLYNYSLMKDEVVVNDRWGNETLCAHGGFFTCKDHYNPSKYLPTYLSKY